MKIGIYSGVFDPIHKGHIAFALAAAKQAGLREVHFMVEHTPRRKVNVTNHKHRLSMVQKAIEKEKILNVLSVEEGTLSVRETLPKLQEKFKVAELYLLLGSDLFAYIETWPDYALLRQHMHFIVGQRKGESINQIKLTDKDCIISTTKNDISSSLVRNKPSEARAFVPQGVATYIAKHRLYENDIR